MRPGQLYAGILLTAAVLPFLSFVSVQAAENSSEADTVSILAAVSEKSDNRSSSDVKNKKNKKKYSGLKKNTDRDSTPGSDTQVDFLDSEDGFWNSRGINDPTLTGGGSSLNSVMFESRPSRRVKPLPSGAVRTSDVEFIGGKSTEITVNGRRISDKSKSEIFKDK